MKVVGDFEMVKIKPANDIIVDKHTPTLVVTPEKGNLHEI